MFGLSIPFRSKAKEAADGRSALKERIQVLHPTNIDLPSRSFQHHHHSGSTGSEPQTTPIASPQHSVQEFQPIIIKPPSPPLPIARVISRSTSMPLLTQGIDLYDLGEEDAFKTSGSSTRSLRAVSRNLDEGFYLHGVTPLSPIVEQDYFSPERIEVALPAESDGLPLAMGTPTGSQHSGIARPSPSYSNFISRPLNRSLSRESTRTHVSTASAPTGSAPPIILGSFSRAQSTRPMPTIVDNGEVHAHHDDASSVIAESFTTAQSTEIEFERDPFADGSSPSSRSSRFLGVFGHTRGNSHPNPIPFPSHRSNPSISSQARTVPIESPLSPSTFFESRWQRSESSPSIFAINSKRLSQTRQWRIFHLTPACLLFWGGFLAPWLWIIGGWYFTSRGQAIKEKRKSRMKELVLPRWTQSATDKETAAVKRNTLIGYPFIEAPSPPGVETATASMTVRSPPVMRAKAVKIIDPWIHRCRVATVVALVLVLIGFVVAFIVVGR